VKSEQAETKSHNDVSGRASLRENEQLEGVSYPIRFRSSSTSYKSTCKMKVEISRKGGSDPSQNASQMPRTASLSSLSMSRALQIHIQ